MNDLLARFKRGSAMSRKLLLALVVMIALVLPLAGAPASPAAGQQAVTQAWVARHNGPGNGTDGANALAVDGAGNVYVTGFSVGSGTQGDYATIKYGPNGSQQWVARYNGPGNGSDQADAIAVDGAGNVYVTGWSGADYATIKYGPNGSQQWVARYNGPGSCVDEAYALAVDGAGNVYVTGSSFCSGTGDDYATIKYGSNGSQQWVARYNGPGSSGDDARAIALDGAGNVYVTGHSAGSGTDHDYATIKYAPNGSQQWVARYNGPGNSHDGAYARAVDGAGNVYVTGWSYGSGTEADYATIKYGPNGSQQWVARYNGPGNSHDGARSLAVDGAGNVYVTGWSGGSVADYDYATIKYGPNGSQQWVARYDGLGNSYFGARSLAVDGAGNVYVTGDSAGWGTDYDYATIKYGPNGSQQWVARYDGPGSSMDYPSAVAVDGAGNVYVTGESVGSGTSFDYATIKYVQGPTPVVVLVHGWDGNSDSTSCGMEPLADYIKTPANMGGHSFKAECLKYRTREGVVAGAVALKQKIDGLGQDKVDIVAHSMGGLVARYYIEKLGGRNKVGSLTMLGTPNWGTAFAIAACDRNWVYLLMGQHDKYDQAACDLIPLSPIILKLNFNPGSHAGVSYNVITGNVGNWLLQRPNDCMVPVASAQGLSFPTTVRAVSHVTKTGAAALVSGCTATGEIDDAGVHDQVRDILLASNSFTTLAAEAPAEVAATATPPPDEPAPDTLAWRNGLIANGDTLELPVTVPGGQPSAMFVFRTPSSAEVALTYSLLRPDGTPAGQSDPDVAFAAGPAFGGFDETHYVITNPTAGVWIIRVVGTTVPVGGWPFDLQALVPGRISVVASAGAGHYDTGEPIALEGDVAIAGTPVADATVDAAVTKPDGTAATVALGGDGSGTYSGSFGDTSACGMYQVLVTASGTDGSTPFTREDRTAAVVGVPGNVILDPCNPDSDGDWLTDQQEIGIYSTNPAAADTDSDGLDDGFEVNSSLTDPNNPDTDGDDALDGADNCALVANPGQENADNQIGNGTGIPGHDGTVPNSAGDNIGDACDSPDADNDGLPDGSDPDPGGDITYDDNNNGITCRTDTGDDGPSWDSNCNGKRDGVEASCPLATNPRGDDDGDGLRNTWEVCKWGTDPAVIDSDGDTLGDCEEAADVDGNRNLDFTGDVMYYAQAIFLDPAAFGQDGDFDIDGNNNLDFTGDVMTEAQFALIAGLCK
jgi:pimeloyl-ACP methyl ester carboxylesterase